MSSVPVPEAPLYRITLFYGPESIDGHPPSGQCVFNVKKRSWKGGIQVAVEVTDAQLAKAQSVAGFDSWLREVLAKIPDEERDEYQARANELFGQSLCGMKLDLAIESGLDQKNQRLGRDHLVSELDKVMMENINQVKSYVQAELDLTV